MNSPKERTILANGLRHHLLEWGVPNGLPTFFLIHGFMDAAATWDLVAPHLLQGGFHCVAMDMRGFGDGPRVPEGAYYHFADYIFDVADAVDAVSPDRPLVVVGHSMGGTIATLFAGAFPERVSHVVLIEGLGPPDNMHEAAPDRMRSWIEGVRKMKANPLKPLQDESDGVRRLAVNHRSVPAEILASRAKLLMRSEGERVEWKSDPLHRTLSPVPFFSGVYKAFAARIKAPVLFVSGGTDGYHPPDENERLAAFQALSKRDFEGAGHMVHWTRSRELAEAIQSFVRSDSHEARND